MSALTPKFLRKYFSLKKSHIVSPVPSRRFRFFVLAIILDATVGYISLNSFDHQKIQGHSVFSNMDLSRQEVLEYKKNRNQTYSSHNNSVAKMAIKTIIATPSLAKIRLVKINPSALEKIQQKILEIQEKCHKLL